MSEVFCPRVEEDGNKFSKCVVCSTVSGAHALLDLVCCHPGRSYSYFPVEPQGWALVNLQTLVEGAWHRARRIVSAQWNRYVHGHSEETEHDLFPSQALSMRRSSWSLSHRPQTPGARTYRSQGLGRGRGGAEPGRGGA